MKSETKLHFITTGDMDFFRHFYNFALRGLNKMARYIVGVPKLQISHTTLIIILTSVILTSLSCTIWSTGHALKLFASILPECVGYSSQHRRSSWQRVRIDIATQSFVNTYLWTFLKSFIAMSVPTVALSLLKLTESKSINVMIIKLSNKIK